MNVQERIEKIDKEISSLIENNDDIKAIVSLGSYSQGAMDEFSDIDLYVLTKDVGKYLDKTKNDWVKPFGKILSRIAFFDKKLGVGKNKIILSDGLMFDLTIVDISKLKFFRLFFFLKRKNLLKLLPNFLRIGLMESTLHFYNTIQRGYQIHHDTINLKELLIDTIDTLQKVKQHQISEEKFLQVNQGFWQCCYDASIKLIRKDFFFKFIVFDQAIRKNLITMIEWRVKSEKDEDVYYDGRKIDKWAGKTIVKELYKTLNYYNEVEMQKSLLKTIELYTNESHYLASKYGYPLNKEFEYFVTNFIKTVGLYQCEAKQYEHIS
jgi:aminoglycoside 6-adenylyltransferase